ncbi:MAG: DUF981 family protein [Candidatus Micrarchaeia archaeon]
MGRKDLGTLAVPGFVLGAFDAVSGFFMAFTWPMPLPLGYNLLFGEPMLFLGLIMTAASYMLYKGIDFRVLSFLGLFLGIYLAVDAAGIAAYNMESGKYFIPAFSLYVLSAVSGILSPLIYANPKKNGKGAYYLMFVLLLLVALVALFIGYSGIYVHLGSPP